MTSEEFAAHPIDEVLVFPRFMPTRVGIGRCTTHSYSARGDGTPWKELWAVTDCCLARVVIDHSGSSSASGWKCDRCEKRLDLEDPPRVSQFVIDCGWNAGFSGPEGWIAAWTGVDDTAVTIRIANRGSKK